MRAIPLRSSRLLSLAVVAACAALPASASADRFTEVSTHITAAGMTDLAVAKDGALWISAQGKGSLLAVQADGQVAERPLTGLGRKAHPAQLAGDAQGHLWSTDPIGPVLTRSDADGSSVDIPTGSAGTQPLDLATGADGNVWFTTVGRTKIGRITSGGALDYFPVTTSPDRIAAGSGDTAVWFTTEEGVVGRVSRDGDVGALATVAGHATGIVESSDGNVWVTTASTVNRVTPGGAVTTFTTGIAAGASINDIAAAPNGFLWFSATGADTIGRVSPEGAITSFATRNPAATPNQGASPQAIAIASNGVPTYFGDNPDPLVASVLGTVDPIGVPTGGAGAAEAIEARTAVLPALINPEAGSTDVAFDYGPTASLGKRSASVPLDPSITAEAVRIPVTELEPLRTYFYRVVAVNAAGTFTGPTLQFTTKNVPLPSTPVFPATPKPKVADTAGGGASATPQAAASTLSLTATAAKISAKGIVKVTLACGAGAPCSGTLEVTAKLGTGKKAKTVVIAKKAVAIKAGATAKVGLRVSSAGRRAVKIAGRKGLATLTVFSVAQTKTRARLILKG